MEGDNIEKILEKIHTRAKKDRWFSENSIKKIIFGDTKKAEQITNEEITERLKKIRPVVNAFKNLIEKDDEEAALTSYCFVNNVFMELYDEQAKRKKEVYMAKCFGL